MKSLLPNATHVLCYESVNIHGIIIHGSPWLYYQDYAYVNKSGYGSMPISKFELITPCDILVTHGPAYQVLDFADYNTHSGSKILSTVLNNIKPIAHLHGHIHESNGTYNNPETNMLTSNAAAADYKTTKVVKNIKIL